MRALICRQWGGIEQLQIGEAPMPRPGRGEVLIRVKATAVNYADAIMVGGRYQTKPELPFSPGLETAGVIEACGPDVRGLQPGDRVMAILAYGGLAEYAVAPAAETYVIPQDLSFAEAGAFPIAYMSSHVALRWQGRLEPGETLLVLGAAGGVGLTAVEIGKAMGARVIAAASTAEKLAVATAHGADATVNYASEKLTERVMALTGERGADVCFDPVGGGLFEPLACAVGAGDEVALARFLEPAALDIRLGCDDGAFGVGDLGALLGLARLDVLDGRLGPHNVGLGLRDPGLVVVVLDLDQKLIGLDALEIVDGHLAEIALDLGAERREVAFDISIVRGLGDVRADPGVPARCEQDRDQRGDGKDAKPD